MICELADEEMVEHILPLRLTSEVLVDTFGAFEQFAMRQLYDGGTVDEFLAALERLACHVGESPPGKWIAYMFIAGVLQYVRKQLWVLVQMDTLTLDPG